MNGLVEWVSFLPVVLASLSGQLILSPYTALSRYKDKQCISPRDIAIQWTFMLQKALVLTQRAFSYRCHWWLIAWLNKALFLVTELSWGFSEVTRCRQDTVSTMKYILWAMVVSMESGVLSMSTPSDSAIPLLSCATATSGTYLASFPGLAVRNCKQREAGRVPENEASTYLHYCCSTVQWF